MNCSKYETNWEDSRDKGRNKKKRWWKKSGNKSEDQTGEKKLRKRLNFSERVNKRSYFFWGSGKKCRGEKISFSVGGVDAQNASILVLKQLENFSGERDELMIDEVMMNWLMMMNEKKGRGGAESWENNLNKQSGDLLCCQK